MKKRIELAGSWALLTGASAGIGKALAFELAERGTNLVIVARNRDRLRDCAEAVTAKHGVSVRVVAADLETPSGVKAMLDEVDALGVEIEHVINNAGFGGSGPSQMLPFDHLQRMTDLNCTSVVLITQHYLKRFCERDRGGFVQIASTAGFLPVPFMAVYGATKAYVLNYSVAVAEELAASNVRMTAVCPGPVPTEFQQRAGYQLTGMQAQNAVSAEKVARDSVKAYLRGSNVCIPGRVNQLQMWGQRFLSLSARAKAAAVVMRKSGRDKVGVS